MYNWNTSTIELKKHPRQYAIWKLEQLINYGLDRHKLDRKQLRKYWSKLSIDPKKRNVLSFLLWGKQS